MNIAQPTPVLKINAANMTPPVTLGVIDQNQEPKAGIKQSYLTQKQISGILSMFDTKEAYAKNFPVLKAITSGLYELMLKDQSNVNPKVKKMFDVINDLQGILLLDDIQEHLKIIRENPI